MTSPSIADLNASRSSIGIVRPTALDVYLAEQDRDESRQWGVKTFPYRTRAKFEDEDGKHDLSILDWGCYEFMRKNPGRECLLPENLRVGPERDVLLLVGNLRNRRNVWCVVSVVSWRAIDNHKGD